jgi:hypothetical protein
MRLRAAALEMDLFTFLAEFLGNCRFNGEGDGFRELAELHHRINERYAA